MKLNVAKMADLTKGKSHGLFVLSNQLYHNYLLIYTCFSESWSCKTRVKTAEDTIIGRKEVNSLTEITLVHANKEL